MLISPWRTVVGIVSIVLVVCAFAGSALAEELDLYAAMENRLNELEQQVAQLQASGGGTAEAAVVAPGCGVDACCGIDSRCWSNCDPCCGYGTFYGGCDLVLLRPYATEGALSPALPYEAGWRPWVGFQSARGWGLRARWLDYEVMGPSGNPGYVNGLELTAIDMELTGALDYGRFHALLSGGFRYAEYTEWDYWWNALDDPEVRFTGWGPTIGVQMVYDVLGGFGLYSSLQQSMLFGDDKANEERNMLGWTEVQVGLQYTTQVGGWNVFARGGAEAQYHNGLATDDSQNTGLFGSFFSLGVNR